LDIKEIKALMKKNGIPGSSKVTKANQQEYEKLANDVQKMSIASLRAELKKKGVVNLSKLLKETKYTFYKMLIEMKRKKKITPSQKLKERKERNRPPCTTDVVGIAESVKKKIAPYSKRIEIAGSIRRKTPSPNDIDIVVIPGKDMQKLKDTITSLGEKIAGGEKRIDLVVDGVKVNIYFAEPENWGAMLLRWTGPFGGNIGLSVKAKKKGWKLSQYGLTDENGNLIASKTEEEIYNALDLPWKPPELRGK